MKHITEGFIATIIAILLAGIFCILLQNSLDKSIKEAYEQGGADGMEQFSNMVLEEYKNNGSLTLNLPKEGQIKLVPEVLNNEDL